MQGYIARRLLGAAVAVVGLSVLVFSLLRAVPGDAAVMVLGEDVSSNPAQLRAVRHQLGLDKPVPVQYANWLSQVARGHFGTSLYTGRSITQEIGSRLPVTLELTLLVIVFSLLISMPIGIYVSTCPDTIPDQLIRFLSVIGLAIPNFWLATVVIVFGGDWLNWIPPVGYTSIWVNPVRNFEQFAVPSLIVAVAVAASQMRLMRSAMLEVLNNDYIRTARSKGLRERIIISRHALKNAMLPVLTLFAGQFGRIITGIVIIETIFSLPGLGRFMLDSINRRDYPMVQGLSLAIGIWVVLLNLATDLAYGWFDPRIRY